MITIITATYNAETELPAAIESLRSQTDSDFKWLIVDGASTDKTIGIIQSIQDLNVEYISEPDFGIYDALNKAVRRVKTPYYLVIGADDRLYPKAIELYKQKAMETSADLITAYTHWGTREKCPKGVYSRSKGIWSVISTHSVGTLIKASLHERFGFYSKRFPIAADTEFLTKLFPDKVRVAAIKEFVGFHSMTGISSTDCLGVHSEALRIRVEAGHGLALELVFFGLKIIRDYARIIKHTTRLRSKANLAPQE